jgi:hypothetical protein
LTEQTVKDVTGYNPTIPLFTLGFGLADLTTSVENYQSLLKPGQDSRLALSLEVAGVVLDVYQYGVFERLLSIASNGMSACDGAPGGYCVLQNSCDAYDDLWKYSFKLEFQGGTGAIIVPLATFAETLNEPQASACKIYV